MVPIEDVINFIRKESPKEVPVGKPYQLGKYSLAEAVRKQLKYIERKAKQ